jgi:hypothetical protein
VALVRTDVSEKRSASNIKVTRIANKVTANIVPSSPILLILMMETVSSYETSVLTRAPWRNIPESAVLHSHSRENLKSHILTTLYHDLRERKLV